MGKRLLFAFVAALLLVSCASSKDDSSTETTKADSSSDDETPTGPAPGVTDDSVKVGVDYVDVDALKAAGLNLDLGDEVGAFQALADDINDKGGINDRQIELVFTKINPQGTQPAEEACLKQTEDEDVFLTIGFFLGDAVLCTIEAHETAAIGGSISKERLDRANAPWFAFEGTDSEDDAITAFAEKGLMEGKKVAVIANVADQARMNDEVLPLLEEHDITPVETATLDAPPDDIPAMTAAVNTAAQKFEAADADVVLAIGQAPTQWSNAMQDQPYRPQLLIPNPTIQAFVESDSTRDFTVLDDAVLAQPYGPFQAVYDEPKMAACRAIIEKALGTEIPSPDSVTNDTQPFYGSFNACQFMTLLEALLEKAGPTLNYGTLDKAGDELGEVEIPGDPAAYSYGPGERDGNVPQHVFAWDAAKKEFVLDE